MEDSIERERKKKTKRQIFTTITTTTITIEDSYTHQDKYHVNHSSSH